MNYTLTGATLELEISLVRGGLTIVEAGREDVELTFSELRRNTADELFTISFQNDLLHIKERSWKKSAMPPPFFRNDANHDLILTIPKGTQLSGSIGTVSGDVRAEALNGSLRIKTISGQMAFGHIDARRIQLQNIGGNLTIDTMVGGISARVISGKCLIRNGRISRFNFSSVSGDISVNADFDLERDSSIQTVSGDTTLQVGSLSGNGDIQISTLSGETVVNGDFPKEKVEIKQRMPFLKNHPFKTVMPAMKNFVSSFTRMGDNDGVEVHAAAEAESTEKHVEQILQMLADGKITADEAERLINALK